MPRMEYDFDEWLQSQEGLDLPLIISNGFDAASDAELIANGLRAEVPDYTKAQCRDFATRTKTLMTLLKWQQKDPRVTEIDWHSFRPICDALVKKEQLETTVLDLF